MGSMFGKRESKRQSLLGRWYGKVNGESVAIEFRDGGQMAYAVLAADKTQVMRMTYRVDQEVLVTDQASSPKEERTGFHFDGDALILEFAGLASRFTR
jgi:hypothetical protein